MASSRARRRDPTQLLLTAASTTLPRRALPARSAEAKPNAPRTMPTARPVDGSGLAEAMLNALHPAALDQLAEMLAPRIAARARPANAPEQWLDARRAAEHLGITANALHKLTAARQVPFEQDAPGCKLWFRRSELDAWRQTGGRRQPSRPART